MELIEQTKLNFNSLAGSFKEDLLGVRTNRPTPKLLENVEVSYLGQTMPLKHLASIGIEPPRDLVVNVWDQNASSSVAKAINDAKLGVSVSEQGKTIRVKLPDLTEERKQELTKVIKSMAEDVRIKMRHERDEAQKVMKEDKDEDVVFKNKERLQGLVDAFNKEVEDLTTRKIGEILE
ncbi:MAG: ribosome-recycling factor [Candidatus Colwellbacteria bacterium]|nr:ribosome-recycling factor [Candidatus Colwellbacteria bacterium]